VHGPDAALTERNTAAALVAASVLLDDDAHGLVRYLTAKENKYNPYSLEKLLYLAKFRPSAGEPVKFSYQKDGKTMTETLESGVKVITFNEQELREANLTALSGDILADIAYTGSPDESAPSEKKLIGLTKKIEPVGGAFTAGGLVKITLTPDYSALDTDIGNTQMILDDYIPAGLRFERWPREQVNSGWFMLSREGQRVRFCIYGASAKQKLSPLTFYARCTLPGTYTVESAYVSSGVSDVWGASERGTLTVS
jgi:hypothetical protein